jgi:hypothetical protein
MQLPVRQQVKWVLMPFLVKQAWWQLVPAVLVQGLHCGMLVYLPVVHLIMQLYQGILVVIFLQVGQLHLLVRGGQWVNHFHTLRMPEGIQPHFGFVFLKKIKT